MQQDIILTQKNQNKNCAPLSPGRPSSLPPFLLKKIVRPDFNGLLIGPSDMPYMVTHWKLYGWKNLSFSLLFFYYIHLLSEYWQHNSKLQDAKITPITHFL